MLLYNYEICDYYLGLQTFQSLDDLYLPIKANFYIQKNLKILSNIFTEIEEARNKIVSHYGLLNAEKTEYYIPEDKRGQLNMEMHDLLNLTQDINLYMISPNDLGDITLTPKQMQALMFMIEE